MGKALDIRGQKFGKLTAIKPLPDRRRGLIMWEFLCDCGRTHISIASDVKCRGSGQCKLCHQDEIRKSTVKHGKGNHRNKVYRAWGKIKSRCYCETVHEYPKYSGVGVYMDDEWVNDFQAFYDYIGEPPKDGKRYSIDRIDNTGNYVKGNIRWADYSQQGKNKGMSRRNKTGVTGVGRYVKNGTCPYYLVTWVKMDGKQGNKCFNINQYGEELAFLMACEYRQHMVDLLNLQGAGYSENQGKRDYNTRGGKNDKR